MPTSATMPLTANRARPNAQGNTALAASQAPVLLRAEGLKKAFGGQVVLDGVDLELRQGEVVLLRGENGSGKTTLLNILTGNLEPDAGTIDYLADDTPRTYHFPRRWWQELNPFDHFTPEFVVREGVGRTWQDIRLFGSQSLRDNIAVAEPGHPGENPVLALFAPGVSARRETALNREADAMLARLGLAGREDSSADKISLGQSKRVAIARAVVAGARILFLDEPLAGLDWQGINDVLDLLKSLVSDHHVTLVIVEHTFNQSYLHGLVTTDWLLANGNIQRVNGNGGASDSASSLSTASSGSSIQRPAWFTLLAGVDAKVVDELLPRGALLTRIRRPGVFKHPPKPVLEIHDLIVKRGSRIVIGLDDQSNPAGFSLTLYEGEIALLQAPNGWGKTTLFAAVCGLMDASQGEIRLQSQHLDGLRTWDRVDWGLSALPSNRHTFPTLKVKEQLSLAVRGRNTSNLGKLDDQLCSSLSGGERQQLAFAGILDRQQRARLYLLDEPFVAYDSRASEAAIGTVSSITHGAILILLPSTQTINHFQPNTQS